MKRNISAPAQSLLRSSALALICALASAAALHGGTINVDINSSAAENYTGLGIVPGDTGTTWNALTIGSNLTSVTIPAGNVKDSLGNTLAGVSVNIASSNGTSFISRYSTTGNTTPNPALLMRDYTFSGTYNVTVSGLGAGAYQFWFFGHGDVSNQTGTLAVDATNGGATGSTADNALARDIINGGNGVSYVFVDGCTVGAAGTFKFQVGNFLNGFQLTTYPVPVIAAQPPPTPSATLGSDYIVTASATGPGTLTYRWQKNNVNISNGPTGNGSTYAGATTNTLTIQNLQNADAGAYRLMVTNVGGSTNSNASALTVTSTPQAPSVSSHPQDTTVLANGTAVFNVVANGSAPLTYVWKKGTTVLTNGASVNGSVISGANTASLSIANAQLADAGSYLVVVGNTVNTATSNSAALAVNKVPTITTQPVSATVAVGQLQSLSTVFGASFPVPVYQWQKSSDGLTWTNVSGGNTPTLPLTGSVANSGFYQITATNSVGSITSSVIYFGVASTQPITFAPGNNPTNIAIDQQLRLTFPSTPKLGLSGALRIHDASNNAVVATIDRSQFVGYTLFGGTIINSMKQTVQGKQIYYLPIAIYGNEAWVTLGVTQRLSYGKTYYVTMDAGLFVDSSNAAVPAITSTTAWRFSTKSAAPATPTTSTGPTEITVGMDGTGDFATVQGAADWVPQNNTLRRNIHVKPGIYRDVVYLGSGRNFITIAGTGASRNDVQLIHLYPAEVYGDGARGLGGLRIDSNDVNVCDLTVDNGVYVAQPNLAGAFAPAAPVFAGPINTVASTGKRLVFDNILMKGGQDTLYTISGIAYFNKCEIWGSVDFIYGDALAVFDQCDIVEIRNTGGPICAPSTPSAQPHGEVFLNSRFPRALATNGYPYDVNTGSTTFMRPWRQDGAVAIINCKLDTQFSTKAWGEWDGRENTCRAREYGNTLIAGGAAPTAAQRQAAGAYWLNTIDPDYTGSSMSPTDALLVSPGGVTNRQAVTINPADYTLTAIFGHSYFAADLTGWMPALLPRFTTQPTGASVSSGAPVTLSVVATGSPTPTYQWFKNGSSLGGQTNATFSLAGAAATDAGSYTATATNSAGSVQSSTAVLTVTSPFIGWSEGFGMNPATDGAPSADPDKDGVVNLLEFAFGMAPTSGGLGVLTFSGGTLLTTGLPSAQRSPGFTARFIRRKTYAADGLTYTPQFSTGLTGWDNSNATPAVIASNANYDLVEVPFPASVSGGPPHFFRVNVMVTP
ncbi:MAG: pectinesterase family protein [Luteolibacter sp.]|uniref:pectinesterase family protein n=1 Tax=Luteolibacter sp. TaxID=1962973 RepID=UPI003263D890